MIEISNDAVVEVLHELQDEGAALGTVVGMAIFGGIVSWLRRKGPRKFSRLVVVLCTAGFAGLVAYYLTNAVGLNDQYQRRQPAGVPSLQEQEQEALIPLNKNRARIILLLTLFLLHG